MWVFPFPPPQIIHCFYPLVLTLDHSLCGQSLNDNRYDKDPMLNACGVSIDKRMTKLTGRVLNCPVVTIYLLFCFLSSSIYTNLLVKIFTFKLLKLPQLKVGNTEDCIPRNGRWNFVHKVATCPLVLSTIALSESSFLYLQTLLQPCELLNDQWAIVNFSGRCDLRHLSRELIKCARNRGSVGSIIHLACLEWVQLIINLSHYVFGFRRTSRKHLCFLKRTGNG